MLEDYLLPILSAGLLMLTCQAVGWPFVQSFRPRGTVVLLLGAFSAGLWLVALAVLFWGAIVGSSAGKLLILWMALLVGCGRHLPAVVRSYRGLLGGGWTPARKAGLALVTALTLWGLAFALVPPLFSDALRYHLGVPHRWLMGGGISELPHLSEQHLVMIWQHAALLLLGAGQPVGAKVFMFLAFPMTLAALAGAVRAAGGSASCSVLAMAILGLTPTFFGNSVLGGVDGGLAFFTAMTLLLLLGSSEANRESQAANLEWIWVGIFAGLALCTKWQGAAVIAGAGIWALLRAGGRGSLIVLLAGAAAYLPWAARNILWSADPFYPFIAQWWSPEAAGIAGRFDRSMGTYGLSGAPWWEYLLYPFHLALGDRFESSIGWAYLILFLPLMAAARRDRTLKFVLIFAGAAFLAGFAMGQLPRFWMPVWVAFALGGGLLWGRCSSRARLALGSALAITAAINLLEITTALNQRGFAPLAYHRHSGNADSFYAWIQPEWRAAEWVRARRSPERVMLVGLDANLFWSGPLVIDGPYDDKTIVAVAKESKSPAEMARRLRQMGISLLVIDSGRAEHLDRQFGYMGWDKSTREKVRKFFATEMVRRYREGSIQIGELR